MKRAISSTLLLLLVSTRAHACLNDSDMIVAEHQFRSAYLDAPIESKMSPTPMPAILVMIGGVFCFGLAAVVLSKPKPNKPFPATP